MKIGIISDIHLHTWGYGATKNKFGFNSRLWDQWQVLSDFVRYCMENKVDIVVCAGDIFHTHNIVPTQALYVAGEVFSQLKDVTVVRGNHDMDSKGSFADSVSWLRHTCRVVSNFNSWEVNGIKLTAIAYTPDREHLSKCLSMVPEGSILFLHQGLLGEQVGNGFVLKDEVLSPSMIPSTVKHCFTGHYHDHKRVSKKLTIIGAMMQHNWGDVGSRRGWLVYDTDADTIEQIESKHPVFLNIDYGAASEPTLERKDMIDSVSGNFIHVMNYSGDINRLRSYYIKDLGARTVEIDTNSTEATGVSANTVDRLSVVDALNAVRADLDARRQEVAVEIVEDKYEVIAPPDI